MPYSNVKEARESIPSLKGLSTAQVNKFIKIFNSLLEEDMSESEAIPLAISRAKKDKINKSTTDIYKSEDILENIEQFKEFISKSSLQQREEMLELLHSVENNSEDNNISDIPSTPIYKKAINTEQRLALFVALPVLSEDDDEYDLHQDTYNDIEVRKAMLNYNEHCMKAGVYHLYETQDAEVTQSYLAPVDFEIEDSSGENRLIKAGTWLQEWYFPETEAGEKLWQKVKDKELTGISVQCNVTIEDIDE